MVLYKFILSSLLFVLLLFYLLGKQLALHYAVIRRVGHQMKGESAFSCFTTLHLLCMIFGVTNLSQDVFFGPVLYYISPRLSLMSHIIYPSKVHSYTKELPGEFRTIQSRQLDDMEPSCLYIYFPSVVVTKFEHTYLRLYNFRVFFKEWDTHRALNVLLRKDCVKMWYMGLIFILWKVAYFYMPIFHKEFF